MKQRFQALERQLDLPAPAIELHDRCRTGRGQRRQHDDVAGGLQGLGPHDTPLLVGLLLDRLLRGQGLRRRLLVSAYAHVDGSVLVMHAGRPVGGLPNSQALQQRQQRQRPRSTALITTAAAGATTVAAANPDAQEIEIWTIFGNTHPFQKVVDSFNSSQTAYRVKNVQAASAYSEQVQKIQSSLAAGSRPAMALISWNLMPFVVQQFGAVAFDTVGGNEKDTLYNRFSPNVLALGQVDGKQMAVPYALSNPLLYINRAVYTQAGLDPNNPPKTWQEVTAAAQQIKDRTGKLAISFNFDSNWMTQIFIESAGGQVLKDSKAAFATGEGAAGMNIWADFYKKGFAKKGVFNDFKPSFESGDLAMMVESSSYLGALTQSVKDNLQVAPFPSIGERPLKLAAGGNTLVVLAQNPKQQQAAWEFIKFATSQTAMNLWATSGYITPIKDKVDQIRFQDVAYKQVGYTTPWAAFPGTKTLQADKLLFDVRTKILDGAVSADDGLKQVQDDINKLLVP